MNNFFDLINRKKIFFLSLNRMFSTFGHSNEKIPTANFYISKKIKNEKTTYKKKLNLRCVHSEKVIWKFQFCF